MANGLGRRFLKTRSKTWVKILSSYIFKLNITPNQISIAGLASAFIAALILLYLNSDYKWLLAVFFIQFRLFCNMLDGLVAIEGGKQSVLGDVYNDLPDRFADIFIILAFGYSFNNIDIINNNYISLDIYILTWFATCLAIFTAYIRTLFSSLGVPADYSGPMAKQHRMFLISLTSIIYFFFSNINIIILALLALNIGCLYTIYRRIKNGVVYLKCH